jgi:hypothetical protein
VKHPGKYLFVSSLQVRWLTNAAIEFAVQETVQEYYRQSGGTANPVIASEAKQSILPEERNWIASSLRSLQ